MAVMGAHKIDNWIFDLDNTLYPAEAALFDQIDARMTSYIMDKLGLAFDHANTLRAHYWQLHGTTLAGLMIEHAIDPDDFLHHVHDICLAHMTPDQRLARAIDQLPGRKIIHTNGSRCHAERVLDACGLRDAFDAIYGVDDLALHPKPKSKAFELLCARADIAPTSAAMIEDTERNLYHPYFMGMQTILVGDNLDQPPHVMYVTNDLTQFLTNTLQQMGQDGQTPG